MCTPTLRALKLRFPRSYTTFYTNRPEVLEGLWYIDEIMPYTKRPMFATYMGYESVSGVIPQPVHLAKVIAARVGIDLDDVTPDCVLSAALVERFKEQWSESPRPYIAVQRRAGPWTSNKNWPDESWEILIESLSTSATIIEIGNSSQPRLQRNRENYVENYIDLRGNTTIAELIACVAAADILVAPVSGPIHIAAAVHTPAVVILGGFEYPENTAYPGNEILHTHISCGPCWLTTPCPIGRECLTRISPGTVQQAVTRLWESILATSESRGHVNERS